MAQAEFSTGEQSVDEDRAGLRDFWTVYEAHYDQISSELEVALAAHPELGPLMAQISPEERAEQERVSREQLRAVVFEGAWEPYLENMKTQGATYARGGLSFSAWYAVMGAFRHVIQDRLVDAYTAEPARLLRALDGLNTFTQVAMETIGEAYLSTKERVIAQQQAAIQELSTPILPLRDGLLLLPLVGMMDSHRARQVTESLLDAISAQRARAVVIDITGVPAVDSMV